MSAFKMQVGCKCGSTPAAMECTDIWDGEAINGLVKGRRYVWTCLVCDHKICINMALVGEEE